MVLMVSQARSAGLLLLIVDPMTVSTLLIFGGKLLSLYETFIPRCPTYA